MKNYIYIIPLGINEFLISRETDTLENTTLNAETWTSIGLRQCDDKGCSQAIQKFAAHEKYQIIELKMTPGSFKAFIDSLPPTSSVGASWIRSFFSKNGGAMAPVVKKAMEYAPIDISFVSSAHSSPSSTTSPPNNSESGRKDSSPKN